MTILALEFSSTQRSVAVARGKSVLSEAIETGGRGVTAAGLIEKVLTDAKIRREEVEAIVVGLGPGSYTGIRSAIAIAQGWRLARGIQLIGISSAEAIAAQAQAEKILGRVSVVIDAQRNEFYVATYEISESEFKEVESLRILSFDELRTTRAKDTFIGPETAGWPSNSRPVYPRATALINLSTHRLRYNMDKTLEPLYLRESNFLKTAGP